MEKFAIGVQQQIWTGRSITELQQRTLKKSEEKWKEPKGLMGYHKKTNMHIMGVPKEEREKEQRDYLKK